MKWYQHIALGIILSCCTRYYIMAHVYTESVLEQLMHAWSLVNIARSITPEDAAFLNEQLFEAHLELYGRLYCGIHLFEVHPSDISLISTALAGLYSSQDALCAVQGNKESASIQQLMKASCLLWQKITSKFPGNSHIPESSG